MTISERIESGALPSCLENSNWQRYAGRGKLRADLGGFAIMWFGVAWVRLQAFERDMDAEAANDDYLASVAAGGWY